MRFTAFYFLSGALFATASIKTTPDQPGFSALFLLALVTAVIGAAFEVANPKP